VASRGRPTKYSVKLANGLTEMFESGQSVAEVCLELRIGRTTFYNWVDKYPKFKRAYEEGAFISEAWWMALGRAGAAGQIPLNTGAWIFNMKNRFKWRDRPDPEVMGDDEMTPEEFARKAHDALNEMDDLYGRSDEGGNIADVEMDTPPTTH